MLCTLQLQGKTDEGFVKGAFKLLRDHLGLKLVISAAQFLEQVGLFSNVLHVICVTHNVRCVGAVPSVLSSCCVTTWA
jgi:hypothetical protein